MKKIFLLFSLSLITPLLLAQTTYYSGGNLLPPDNVSSWFTNTNGTGSNPTDFSNSGDTFIIQPTHTMITSASWSPAGNVVINGTLVASNAVTVGGTLTVSNGGTYQHNQNGGTVPAATWQTGSTCVITGVTGASAPGGLTQSFYNLTWSSANTGPISINPSAINGNLNITAGGTGSNTFGLSTSTGFAIDGGLNLSGTANFLIQSGGSDQVIVVYGNFSMTGGTLNLSNGSAEGELSLRSNFSQTSGNITETGSGVGVIAFQGSSPQSFTSVGTVTNAVYFVVSNGATLQMASSSTVLAGNTFLLNNGGTLGITSADGISSSGATGNIQTINRTFDPAANYIYNGNGDQNTGNGLPNNLIGVLTINNTGHTVTLNNAETIASGGTVALTSGTFAAGTNLTMASTSNITRSGGSLTGTLQGSGSYNVTYTGNLKTTGAELNGSGLQDINMSLTSGQMTAGGAITVNGNWTIGSGTTFDAGSYTHNLKGNWNNSGSLTGNTSTFIMSGSAAQTMSGSTFNNLTINNSSGVSMLTDETVNGTLTLTSGNFNIGSNTLNINGAISAGGGSLVGGSNSNITFGGTGASTTLPAITNDLNNLTINRANGITLGADVIVNGTLTFTNGIISPSGYNLTAASTSGGNSTSFVAGPLRISGNAATETFQIGKGSDYRPVTLSSLTGTSGSTVISAELFNAGSGGSPTSPLTSLSTVHYWFVQVITSSFSSATVTLSYGANDGVTDYTHLALGQSSAQSGAYQNYSSTLGGTANGSGTITSQGNVLTLGYFTLANYTGGTNPLPIELTSFTASVSNGTVNLKWSTATEVNNYGFDVERSVDSKTWTKIGFVAGAGNNSSPKNYSFADQPDGGASFSYRLKQIDVGGAYKYYDPITVSLNGGDKAQLMQNSPNPFNPSTAIKYYIPQAVDVTITIYDVLGREVTKLVNSQVEAGYHVVYWNGRDRFGNAAASGVYIYRLTAGNFTEIKKMNLLK